MKKTIITYISILGVGLYLLSILYSPSGPQWTEKSHNVSDITMSNPINQVFYSFILILIILSIIPHYKKFLIWLNLEKYILFFLLWCGLTIIFALDPFISFKRYLQYILTSLVFISFYLNITNMQSFIKLLKYLFSSYLIITLIVCLTITEAKDPTFNTWRGLHATKNNLGQYASIITIFFIFYYFSQENIIEKIKVLLIILIGLLLLIGSFSMTNLVLMFLFLVFITMVNINKIFYSIGLGIKILFLFIGYFIISFTLITFFFPEILNFFFEVIGKDPSLTGRTEIWALVLNQNFSNLITGVGFQSFWIPEKLSKIILFQYWLPNQSHNGYIDMILEIGMIGLLLFILTIYKLLKQINLKEDAFEFTIIIYVLLLNFSESTLIRPHHFSNVMFYFSFWSLSYKRLNKFFTYYETNY